MDPDKTTELNLEQLKIVFELIATTDYVLASIDEVLTKPTDENGLIPVLPEGLEAIATLIRTLKNVIVKQTEHDQEVLEALEILLSSVTPK